MDALKKRLLSDMPTFDSAKAWGVSSVLIPLGWNTESQQYEIVLTKRTHLVESHKGQVSFPGGFYEVTDSDVLHTALRELEEEIGVKKADVEVLGRLTPVVTLRQVQIFPWVGHLTLPYSFNLNPSEVERLLFLPLSQLLTDGLLPVTLEMEERTVATQGIYVDGELVWGATGKILSELRDHLLQLV